MTLSTWKCRRDHLCYVVFKSWWSLLKDYRVCFENVFLFSDLSEISVGFRHLPVDLFLSFEIFFLCFFTTVASMKLLFNSNSWNISFGLCFSDSNQINAHLSNEALQYFTITFLSKFCVYISFSFFSLPHSPQTLLWQISFIFPCLHFFLINILSFQTARSFPECFDWTYLFYI